MAGFLHFADRRKAFAEAALVGNTALATQGEAKAIDKHIKGLIRE